ncbi:hypothetical protein [Oleispirillum naphthae]|uniref:O-antigen ligase family protein n=1 Tax=Oleispirillum naphthae TaxID=2838853 RepID=UPI0030822736
MTGSRGRAALVFLAAPWWLPPVIFMNKATVLMLGISTLACAALACRSARSWRWPWLPPLALGFVAWCALSAIWSLTPLYSFLVVARMLAVCAALTVFLAGAAAFSGEEAARFVRIGACAWGAALLLAGVDATFHDQIQRVLLSLFGRPGEAPEVLSRMWYIYKNGAVILVLTAFPVFAVLLRKPSGRWLVPAAAAVLIWNCRQIGAASALTGFVCGLLIWALAAVLPRAARVLLCIGIPAAVLLMPVLLATVEPQAVARAVPDFPLPFFHRLLVWDFVRDRIAEHPFLGWGVDTAREMPGGSGMFTVWFPVPWMDRLYGVVAQKLPLHPHNMPLQTWLEVGGVGALALAVTLFSLSRRWLSPIGDTVLAGAKAGWLAAAMVVAVVSFGMWQMWWLALLGLCVGFFALVEHRAAA